MNGWGWGPNLIASSKSPKGFTVIEILIVIAIVSIIGVILWSGMNKTPSPSSPHHSVYEGWTHVTELPRGGLYMKRVSDQRITVYWNSQTGCASVVKD